MPVKVVPSATAGQFDVVITVDPTPLKKSAKCDNDYAVAILSQAMRHLSQAVGAQDKTDAAIEADMTSYLANLNAQKSNRPTVDPAVKLT